jgi:hypothetical protein
VREAQQPKASRLDATHQAPQLRLEDYKMSMRDKIAHIIINDHDQHISAASTADAILEALPSMIAPLVWYRAENGEAVISPRSFSGEYYKIETFQGKFTLRLHYIKHYSGLGLYPTEDAAKAAANTHHRASLMAAFTGETK